MLSVTDLDTHTHTSVDTAPTLTLPSMGPGWVHIPPLLLEKCQSLQLPCREEEGGRKEKGWREGVKGRKEGAGAKERRKETEMLKDTGRGASRDLFFLMPEGKEKQEKQVAAYEGEAHSLLLPLT